MSDPHNPTHVVVDKDGQVREMDAWTALAEKTAVNIATALLAYGTEIKLLDAPTVRRVVRLIREAGYGGEVVELKFGFVVVSSTIPEGIGVDEAREAIAPHVVDFN
jgi:hypothetical protein